MSAYTTKTGLYRHPKYCKTCIYMTRAHYKRDASSPSGWVLTSLNPTHCEKCMRAADTSPTTTTETK